MNLEMDWVTEHLIVSQLAAPIEIIQKETITHIPTAEVDIQIET